MALPAEPITWAARVIGAIGAVMWAIPLVAGVVTGDSSEDGELLESLGVAVLAIANIGAVVLAFRRQRQGGMLLLATGGLFSIFGIATAGRNHWLAALVSGGPFILSGALFITAAAARSRNPQTVD